MRGPRLFMLAACAVWLGLGAAQAQCRQALALGLDVSGSVDGREYRLQLDGLASALRDPDVRRAFLAMPSAPVRLLVYEWAGQGQQRVLVGWQAIENAYDLDQVAQQLESTTSRYDDPATAIGTAMIYGSGHLARQTDCWQKTLDISGDGPANRGPHPGDIEDTDLGDIIINGLVIGPNSRANTTKDLSNVKTLEAYFRAYVIRGRGAFVETALDFDDVARVMRRKLLREVASPVLSDAGQTTKR